MNILTLILVGIVGVVLGTWLGRNSKRRALVRASSIKKDDNKKRVLEFLVSSGRITNNDVENMLNVSDATATRYLDELEKEGKLTQRGKTGQSVFYTKK